MSDISEPTRAYLRLHSIIGDRKRGKSGLLPICATTWWAGCKTGRFPKPVKLGPRITAWRVADIEALMRQFDGVVQPSSSVSSATDKGGE